MFVKLLVFGAIRKNKRAMNEPYEHFKDLGNKSFKNANYRDAMAHYDKALQMCNSGPSSLEQLIIHNNIAMCHFHIKNFEQCMHHVEIVLTSSDKSDLHFDQRQQWYGSLLSIFPENQFLTFDTSTKVQGRLS